MYDLKVSWQLNSMVYSANQSDQYGINFQHFVDYLGLHHQGQMWKLT